LVTILVLRHSNLLTPYQRLSELLEPLVNVGAGAGFRTLENGGDSWVVETLQMAQRDGGLLLRRQLGQRLAQNQMAAAIDHVLFGR
jgi:hypothetical protein